MDTLPDLPPIRQKTEATITTEKILPWVKENLGTCALEIKATYKKSMPHSVVADHQKAALIQARTGTFMHKISDAGHTRVPFDAFVLQKVPAFVVACFLHEDDRVALFIPIEDWHGAMSTSRATYRVKI